MASQYRNKTNDELRFIVKDAGEAAVAMRDINPAAEAKYLDQVNDASTELHRRSKKLIKVEIVAQPLDDSFDSVMDEAHRQQAIALAAPDLLAALEASLPALIRLGDFVGNVDAGGASGMGRIDRCALVSTVRAAIAKARGQ